MEGTCVVKLGQDVRDGRRIGIIIHKDDNASVRGDELGHLRPVAAREGRGRRRVDKLLEAGRLEDVGPCGDRDIVVVGYDERKDCMANRDERSAYGA